jgi:hypothetical protein
LPSLHQRDGHECHLPFGEFRGKLFALLWRGRRDGFDARDFHGRSASTLTLILDTSGNAFGGFTRLKWESLIWNGKSGPRTIAGNATIA